MAGEAPAALTAVALAAATVEVDKTSEVVAMVVAAGDIPGSVRISFRGGGCRPCLEGMKGM